MTVKYLLHLQYEFIQYSHLLIHHPDINITAEAFQM